MPGFWGTIKNKEELAARLQLDNDTKNKELLKKGYQCLGNDFFEKINGLFGLVIKDRDKYVLVRDRFGARSLYYAVLPDGQVLFAESIGDILKTGQVKKAFREDLLGLYLSFSYLPGNETFFKGIYKVMPGYIYEIENGRVKKSRYFTPHMRPDENLTFAEHANRLQAVLEEVLADSCGIERADPEAEGSRLSKLTDNIGQGGEKRTASLLSSGVDSSLMGLKLKVSDTYTADYENENFSEAALAESMSRTIGAVHHRCVIGPESYLACVGETMAELEQPTGDASAEVLYLMGQMIARDYDSCFSGEGIDELFYGYYYGDVIEMPEGRSLKDIECIGTTQLMSEDEKREILLTPGGRDKMELCEEAYALTAGMKPICQMAMLDLLLWFEGNILRNVDRIGRGHGLTMVTPYLDNRLLEVALSIPAQYSVDQKLTKRAFRQADSAWLDKDVAMRAKKGFPVPIRLWIRRPDFEAEIKRAFASETAGRFFRSEKLLAIYEAYLKDENDSWHWRQIWNIYCFIIWYEGAFLN